MCACVCVRVRAPFWTFHDGITFERIKLEGWNLLQSAHNEQVHLENDASEVDILGHFGI